MPRLPNNVTLVLHPDQYNQQTDVLCVLHKWHSHAKQFVVVTSSGLLLFQVFMASGFASSVSFLQLHQVGREGLGLTCSRTTYRINPLHLQRIFLQSLFKGPLILLTDKHKQRQQNAVYWKATFTGIYINDIRLSTKVSIYSNPTFFTSFQFCFVSMRLHWWQVAPYGPSPNQSIT